MTRMTLFLWFEFPEENWQSNPRQSRENPPRTEAKNETPQIILPKT